MYSGIRVNCGNELERESVAGLWEFISFTHTNECEMLENEDSVIIKGPDTEESECKECGYDTAMTALRHIFENGLKEV